jgi:hypothetical protein
VAGVAPWIQWRGFAVLALLIAGNLFCMACPFMLPRRLAKKLLPADRSWPAALRPKWLALGLLVVFFWAYEAFDLWASPLLTAWLVQSLVVEGFWPALWGGLLISVVSFLFSVILPDPKGR